MTDIADAAAAAHDGELVVYPTETVYGLGADATDADAVERVFAAKGRDRDDPLSVGFPDVDAALEYVAPTARARRFMHEYLPGPVTVIVAKTDRIPDVVTGGRDRVGVRVPSHERARTLLAATPPLTATSANPSGEPAATRVDDLDPSIVDAAAAVVDGGETGGGGSTVVDPERGEIIREGPLAEEIRLWLQRE